MSEDRQRVVIAGAGPAGLTAAYEILSRGGGDFDVTVVEATDSIGGISKTVRHNGNRMDIGGHRFFTKDARVEKWWHDMLPSQSAPASDDAELGREVPLDPGGADPEETDGVMLSRHRVSRIYYDHTFFDYPVSLNARTMRALGLGRTMSVGASYIASAVRPVREDSLEDFYINRFGRKLYSMFFEGYTTKLWGRHPSRIDASWGAQRVKGLSVSAVLKNAVSKAMNKGKGDGGGETSLIERFEYPKLGPGEIWETAARKVEELGGNVIMGHEVTAVRTHDGRVSSVVAGGEEFPCDVLMSTMPVKDLVAAFASGGTDVPEEVSRVAEGLPYRDFVTVGLLFDHLALRNETDLATISDIVPDNWIYVQDSGIGMGRIQVFNNWSPYLVRDNHGTVWLGLEYFCSEGDATWSMPERAFADMAAGELMRMGVIDETCKLLDWHRERMPKAYPAYFDTYDDFGEVRDWLCGMGNLWCLGRNGQHRYNNMDHSMLTAFYAADAVLDGDSSRQAHDRVWNVNTEAEYHEEK